MVTMSIWQIWISRVLGLTHDRTEMARSGLENQCIHHMARLGWAGRMAENLWALFLFKGHAIKR